MALDATLVYIKNAVFELIFVLTSDNHWIGWFTILAMLVDYFQILSFGFHYSFNWGVIDFQEAIEYTVLPWSVRPEAYYVVVAATWATLFTLLFLLYQVYQYGTVTSIRLLQFGRVSMIVCSTVLFFPFLETFLYPFRVLLLAGPSGVLSSRDITTYQVDPTYPQLLSTVFYVISGISFVFFYLPVMLFYSLYTISDPTNKSDFTAKISTRPELIDIALRSGLVVMFCFVKNPIVNNAVYIIVVCTSFAVHVYYPYFVRRGLNYLRGAILASQFFVGLMGAYISRQTIFYPKQDNSMVAYVTLGLLPLAALIGVLMVWSRFRFLDASRYFRLPDGDQQLIRRCRMASDIELASRRCLDFLNDGEMLNFAQRIFEQGLKKFPKSGYLHARYAIFLVFVMKPYLERMDTEASMDIGSLSPKESSRLLRKLMNSVHSVIRKTFLLNPLLDIQYFFFYAINLLEQQQAAEEAGVDKLHLVEAIRFKHDLRAARNHYEKANDTLIRFWSLLNSDRISSNRLSSIADEFSSHTENANWYFNRLMQKFPKSSIVIDSYKGFLRDILNDEKRAIDLEVEAKRLAELKRQIESSKASLGDVTEDMGASDVNLYQTLARSLGRDSNRFSTKERWFLPVIRVQQSMMVTLFLTLLSMILVYSYFIIAQTNSPSVDVGSMGATRRASQVIAYRARQIEMSLSFNISDQIISRSQTDLITQSNTIINAVKAARLDTVWYNEDIGRAWNTPDTPIIVRDLGGAASTFLADINTLFSMYTSNAFYLSQQRFATNGPYAYNPVLTFQPNITSKFIKLSQWAFIIDNGLNQIVESTWQILGATTKANEELIGRSKMTYLALGVASGVLILLVVIFFVVPSVGELIVDRKLVYRLFTQLNHECIDELVNRHKAFAKILKRSGFKTSQSSTTIGSTGTTNSDALEYDGFQLNISKRAPIWTRLAFVFFISMTISMTLIGLITYYDYSLSNQLFYTSAEVNYSGSRRSSTYRIMTLFQELIRADYSMWGSSEPIRKLLDREINRLAFVHQGVKYGNETLGLPGSVKRYAPQDSLLFDRSCTNNTWTCLGLDEMLALFLQTSRSLLAVQDSDLSWNNQLFLDIKSMVNGQLSIQLDASKALFVSETVPLVADVTYKDGILFGITFPIVFIEMLLIYILCQYMRHNISSSRQLLRLIPIQYQVRIPAIGHYLKSAKLQTKSGENESEEVQTGLGATKLATFVRTMRGSFNHLMGSVMNLDDRRPSSVPSSPKSNRLSVNAATHIRFRVSDADTSHGSVNSSAKSVPAEETEVNNSTRLPPELSITGGPLITIHDEEETNGASKEVN